VSLCPSPYRGTKAVAVLPDSIVVAAAENKGTYSERILRDSAQLDLRAPEVLSLAGAVIPGQATADSPGARRWRPPRRKTRAVWRLPCRAAG